MNDTVRAFLEIVHHDDLVEYFSRQGTTALNGFDQRMKWAVSTEESTAEAIYLRTHLDTLRDAMLLLVSDDATEDSPTASRFGQYYPSPPPEMVEPEVVVPKRRTADTPIGVLLHPKGTAPPRRRRVTRSQAGATPRVANPMTSPPSTRKAEAIPARKPLIVPILAGTAAVAFGVGIIASFVISPRLKPKPLPPSAQEVGRPPAISSVHAEQEPASAPEPIEVEPEVEPAPTPAPIAVKAAPAPAPAPEPIAEPEPEWVAMELVPARPIGELSGMWFGTWEGADFSLEVTAYDETTMSATVGLHDSNTWRKFQLSGAFDQSNGVIALSSGDIKLDGKIKAKTARGVLHLDGRAGTWTVER